jgi:hypothetical protein
MFYFVKINNGPFSLRQMIFGAVKDYQHTYKYDLNHCFVLRSF